MGDADITIAPAGSTKVDTRTVGAGTDEHRQVVVLGDPTTAAAVAAILNAAPGAGEYGLIVRVAGTVAVASLPVVALDAPTLAALETIGLDAATLTALETINVGNLPAVQPVNDNGGSLTVDGTFWQATQPVSGPLTDVQLRASVVPISDGGGVLTVDGTVSVTALPAGTNNIGDVDVLSLPAVALDGSTLAALETITVANPTVEYVEDAAAAANPTGAMGMAVRQDTLSGATVSADGDNIALRATSKGELYVKQADAVPVTDNGASLTVDGTVAATQSGAWNVTNISGTVSLPTGASTSAKQDTIIGHVDGLEAVLATIDADTGALAGAVAGTEVQVDVVGSLPAGAANIGDVDVASFASGAIAEVQGDVAHDAAAAGNPVLLGGYASTAAPTNVSADGDAVRLWADRAGRLQVGDGGASLTVDGTFWQATQPVSGTVTANAGTGPFPVSDNGGSLTVDGTVAVTGTFWQATQPVSGTVSVNALPAGTANIGDVDVLSLPAVALDATTLTALETINVGNQTATTGAYGTVSVTTSATEVRAADANRRSISVHNAGTATVFIGYDGSVTTANGMPIPAGGERELRTTLAVHAIAASGTQDTRYMTEVA